MSDQAPPPPPYQPYPAYPPPPPGYAYVPLKPPKPEFPHDRPRPYHQMLRTWDYQGWKPTVGILAVIVGFVIVAPVMAVPILIVGSLIEGTDLVDMFESGELDVTPAFMLYLNVSISLAILVTWGIIRVIHGMKPRWLASVAPRIRWNFLLVCLGLSVVAVAASIGVGLLLPADSSGDLGGELNSFTSTAAWIALIVLLTTPFQSAGEEYVFRGYLLQAVGSLTERPWWKWFAIVFTAFVFACAHLQFDGPVFFDRFAFGVVAAWVAIKTGGLEAGIALHILNNYVAFGFALAFGDISESLNDPQASWWNILATLTQSLTYAALVWYVAKRMNLQNTTRPPAAVGATEA